MYDKQEKYPQALEFYNKAFSIYERDNRSIFCADILKKIGNIHRSQNSYDEALKYYNKALTIDP
jgi:tetratricopeptide (TPR) repeat protein